LRDGARRVLKLIVQANARRDKIDLLHDIREETEALKVALRQRRASILSAGKPGGTNVCDGGRLAP